MSALEESNRIRYFLPRFTIFSTIFVSFVQVKKMNTRPLAPASRITAHWNLPDVRLVSPGYAFVSSVRRISSSMDIRNFFTLVFGSWHKFWYNPAANVYPRWLFFFSRSPGEKIVQLLRTDWRRLKNTCVRMTFYAHKLRLIALENPFMHVIIVLKGEKLAFVQQWVDWSEKNMITQRLAPRLIMAITSLLSSL